MFPPVHPRDHCREARMAPAHGLQLLRNGIGCGGSKHSPRVGRLLPGRGEDSSCKRYLQSIGGRRIAPKSISLSRRRSSLQGTAQFTWWCVGFLVQSHGTCLRFSRDIDGWCGRTLCRSLRCWRRAMAFVDASVCEVLQLGR